MAWGTPKVDWAATDYLNIEDWERIHTNLVYINTWFSVHNWPSATLYSIDLSRGINTIPYISEVNRLERNLTAVHKAANIPFSEWRASKVWYARTASAYSANPTYDDWNRWEMLSKRLKESIDYVSTYQYQRVSGTFYAGNNNRIQHFSRGR